MAELPDNADDDCPLDPAEAQELWLGINPNLGSYFPDREAVETAWARHRDWLMQEFGSHGKRPMAWYVFERPDVPFSDDHESSTLWRAGVFTEAERAEVEREWYCEFEHAHARGFDAARRRAHYRWADIPPELARRWAVERRCRGKTIRALKDPPAPDVKKFLSRKLQTRSVEDA